MKLSRILITPGEPAGIGPDVLIQAAQRSWNADLIAITDPALINKRAREINLPIQIVECDLTQSDRQPHQPGKLRIHPVKFADITVAGKLNIKNAYAVLDCLQIAANACMEKTADAMVTGPVHKAIMNNAGIAFTGHTEYLAQLAEVKQTVMLFVVDQLKAALVTTHIPLQKVSAAITVEKLTDVLTILNNDLKKYFHETAPRILVAGLNPHAGESGHLGSEEINIISPALEKLRKEGLKLEGPLPADTIFTPAVLQDADAVVGMYHDQILPVIKYIGFDRAVNMTLGLPFLRTSVDHGTALDIAGSGTTNPGSMCAAIQTAINCCA
ncbi:MAG TPA: 4-hydroxythreonine-4-phosphate dehydrogenase PdxA [Gammaproteobacteria bacterium]|jgi:4-hydroxythreonine-4-phosphate dehydrogenase|nr:4-hydroxythreonine-4-phosphate dehydrogenase PdxA [Gammaproteobacteria bacterium]